MTSKPPVSRVNIQVEPPSLLPTSPSTASTVSPDRRSFLDVSLLLLMLEFYPFQEIQSVDKGKLLRPVERRVGSFVLRRLITDGSFRMT